MSTKKENKWKYNSEGYISIEGYLKHLNNKWEQQDTFMIMNAPRNIGKSVGMWNYIEQIWDTYNGEIKICYCRSNGEKIKHAKENFNSKFRGKYYMNDSKIYKQTFDENGKEILKERKEYGSVISLAQSENYKSGNFVNHQVFFWDEYNETLTDREQFIKFIDVLKTVKRKTSPFHVFLIGNKVNSTNDILHNLEIDLDDIPGVEKDYWIEFAPNMYFIEIGNDTFKQHNPKDDLIHRLAVFNERTNAYLNDGSYLDTRVDNLILYSKYVEPTKEVYCYFTSDDYIFEFGDFLHKSSEDEDDAHLYFHMIKKLPQKLEHPVYSINVMGDMRNVEANMMSDKQLERFFKMIKHNAKLGRLWFCENDTRLEIEYYICKLFV